MKTALQIQTRIVNFYKEKEVLEKLHRHQREEMHDRFAEEMQGVIVLSNGCYYTNIHLNSYCVLGYQILGDINNLSTSSQQICYKDKFNSECQIVSANEIKLDDFEIVGSTLEKLNDYLINRGCDTKKFLRMSEDNHLIGFEIVPNGKEVELKITTTEYQKYANKFSTQYNLAKRMGLHNKSICKLITQHSELSGSYRKVQEKEDNNVVLYNVEHNSLSFSKK